MRTLRTRAAAVIASLVVASPLLAHHEWPVDRRQRITLHGTVTAITWANPHVMIAVDVQSNGSIEHWRIGGSSPQFMTTCGWTKNTLKPGDVIAVVGYRFKDGSTAVLMRTIVLPSGQEMYYGAPPLSKTPCVPQGP